MLYNIPIKAHIVDKNYKKVTLEQLDAQDLFFSLSRKHRSQLGLQGKLLHVLGGRNEFEISRQKKIVDWLEAKEKPGCKRVLIIGDSIRMRLNDTTGYGIYAYQNLIEKFNLTHIPHNTGGTNSVLQFIKNWLSCKPDIVHINAGLHDLAFDPIPDRSPPAAYNSIEQYAANLNQIITIIKESGVQKIIWGSNTPVQEQWHLYKPRTNNLRAITRTTSDVIKYNQTAEDVMRKHGVEINDMFNILIETGVEECLIADGVHLNNVGSRILGNLVATNILKYE